MIAKKAKWLAPVIQAEFAVKTVMPPVTSPAPLARDPGVSTALIATD